MHRAVIVIGEDEVAEDVVMLRNMADGTQEKVATDELIEKIKRYFETIRKADEGNATDTLLWRS